MTEALPSFLEQPLYQRRRRLFGRVLEAVLPHDVEIVYLTHLLPDRFELIEAISRVVKIRRIVAIPYSIDVEVLASLKNDHEVICPSLVQLRDAEFLKSLLSGFGDTGFMIVEIGGYFSTLGNWLVDRFGDSFLGVLESTESGHRRYVDLENPRFPIWSVARSAGKTIEDTQVGASSIYATERYLRGLGLVLSGAVCLVVGYGKIGRGLAHTLRGRGCVVLVFDRDPLQRMMALGEGFSIPKLSAALEKVQIVFGATGTTCLTVEQIGGCNSGTLLVSCTSKDIEFDVVGLRRDGRLVAKSVECETHLVRDRAVHLLAAGHPANFLFGGVIGPLLSLVHAELLGALAAAVVGDRTFGLRSLDVATERSIAESWISEFVDDNAGVSVLMPEFCTVPVAGPEAQ
jgi:adenosylhomocysteinase